MPPEYVHRFEKTQKMMADCNIDILFVNNRENLIYYTGLTQIECLAVIIPQQGEPCAVTLWLDAEYVRQETGLKTYGYHFPRQNLAEKCVEVIKAVTPRPARIGFERYFVPFAVYDGLRKAFSENSFVDASELFYRIRAVKEASEVAKIRKASSFVCAGMEAAVRSIRPGIREVEVLAEAEYAMLKAGSGGSPFRPQVVSGERALLTHPCASNKVINEGEIVVVHLGATYEGYCAKMCRTVAVGSVATGYRDVYQLLLKAQDAAINALKPGVTAAEVDAVARAVIEEAGFGNYYLDIIGYGVGLRQSEFYPIIGKGRADLLEAGMVVDVLLPTIYKKGIGGPRVTDCIFIGAKNNEILTQYPRDLIQT
ncbi:peptidase M24 [Thermosinus carboxydivorans Nor1]|uniref:Peptidase M24 n=1 Tax=Thermosinus carboxydivorans Nor1 TaxID=401526 RepID=A1HNW4_9FIRM|nr:Xaa-Pro peptidase family protein [Thermosinus carboxydivorans]EAX48466.1 peptidase M24 [Thermosinus carboxydivorans Nor1]